MFPIVIIAIFAAVVCIIFSAISANKRRQTLKDCAVKLGLQFYPDSDYSFDERYPFLQKLCHGDNRYAFNRIQGVYRHHHVMVFDYHYETTSTDSDGDRKTRHHYFSFFILNFDRRFPELILAREGWMSKIAQWFGYDDIDFESAEFSRKFVVRSADKKFAYDIFHPRMMEYFLRNDDVSIEIERDCLTFFFSQRLSVEQIRYNLDRLVEVRNLFPDYLMGG